MTGRRLVIILTVLLLGACSTEGVQVSEVSSSDVSDLVLEVHVPLFADPSLGEDDYA